MDQPPAAHDGAVARYNKAVQDFDDRNALLDAEQARQEQNEELRKTFAGKAEALKKAIVAYHADIDGALLTENLEQRLDAVNKVGARVAEDQSFGALKESNDSLADAGVLDNPHTTLTFAALEVEWKQLAEAISEKAKIIDHEIQAEKGRSLSSEQLKEFRAAFQHFDKDKQGSLDPIQFMGALKILGEDTTEEQAAGIHKGLDKDGDGRIVFDEFVDYMSRTAADQDSADQMKDNFAVIANGKDHVTEADMRAVMKAQEVDYLVANMPKVGEDQYDYKAWVASVYSKEQQDQGEWHPSVAAPAAREAKPAEPEEEYIPPPVFDDEKAAKEEPEEEPKVEEPEEEEPKVEEPKEEPKEEEPKVEEVKEEEHEEPKEEEPKVEEVKEEEHVEPKVEEPEEEEPKVEEPKEEPKEEEPKVEEVKEEEPEEVKEEEEAKEEEPQEVEEAKEETKDESESTEEEAKEEETKEESNEEEEKEEETKEESNEEEEPKEEPKEEVEEPKEEEAKEEPKEEEAKEEPKEEEAKAEEPKEEEPKKKKSSSRKKKESSSKKKESASSSSSKKADAPEESKDGEKKKKSSRSKKKKSSKK